MRFGTQSQPTPKVFSGGKFFRKGRSQFAEQHQHGGRLEAGHRREVHAQDAKTFLARQKVRLVLLWFFVARLGGGEHGVWVRAGIERFEHRCDLFIAGSDERLVLLPKLVALAQHEEVFLAPITLQTFGDDIVGGLDAMVFERGQLLRVAFTLQYRFE